MTVTFPRIGLTLTHMNLSRDDVIAILKKLKGERVYLRLRLTADDDSSLGAFRFGTTARVKDCDNEGLRLTWSPDGELYLRFDGATFRLPDQNESALIGLQIARPDGLTCVICPSGPLDRVINQLFNRAIGKPRIGEQN